MQKGLLARDFPPRVNFKKMAEDHLDIFKFGRSGKPKLGANRKAGPLGGRIPPLPRPGRNFPSSSDSSDDEEEGRPRR